MTPQFDVPARTTSNLSTDSRREDVPVDPHDLGATLARRSLMLGAGAAALVAGTTLSSTVAEAAPRSATSGGSAAQQASPVTTTIASAPISGYVYRHASWLDFFPEGGTANRSYGGYGAFSSTADAFMWATVEIPAGALVRDIEWYVRNVSGTTVSCLGRLWTAGVGSLFPVLVDTEVESGGSGVVARRSVVPAADYGPHPLGTKITLGVSTTTDAKVQVNGARVGFSHGAGAVGLLSTPVRAYDSRVSGGKLTGGTVRTITLSSSLVRPGTTGLVVNITSTESVANGYLKAYPGNSAEPAVSTLNFQAGKTIANGIVLGVSSSRQIKIYASKTTHVIVDVSGTVG